MFPGPRAGDWDWSRHPRAGGARSLGLGEGPGAEVPVCVEGLPAGGSAPLPATQAGAGGGGREWTGSDRRAGARRRRLQQSFRPGLRRGRGAGPSSPPRPPRPPPASLESATAPGPPWLPAPAPAPRAPRPKPCRRCRRPRTPRTARDAASAPLASRAPRAGAGVAVGGRPLGAPQAPRPGRRAGGEPGEGRSESGRLTHPPSWGRSGGQERSD